MSNKRAAAAASTVLGLVLASSAIAADRGFYLGASGGQSTFDTDIDFDSLADDVAFPLRSSDLDKRDTAFSAFGGYRFFRYLAVEAEYIDLGKLSYTATGSIFGLGASPFTLGLDVETDGFAGSVLGILPLSERWELFGRAGFLFGETTVRGSLTGPGFSDSSSTSDHLEFAMIGVGAALNIQERWTLRLEYRAFEDVDNEETTLDYTSLAVVYRL